MAPLIEKWRLHRGGTPDGVPMLMLHGFMGSGNVWIPIIGSFSEDFSCLAPDLPGHGQTRANLEQLSFDTVAESLVALGQSEFTRPPVLVGYSMGGRLALYTALKYPDRFSALVLESASGGIADPAEQENRLALDTERAADLRRMPFPSFLKEWYKQPLYDSLRMRPGLVENIIGKKSGGDSEQLAEVIVRLSPGNQPPLWDKLLAWRMPTLVVAGELDTKYAEQAARMAEGLPDSRLEIIPDAGHIVHLEQRDRFIAVLKSFLRERIL